MNNNIANTIRKKLLIKGLHRQDSNELLDLYDYNTHYYVVE